MCDAVGAGGAMPPMKAATPMPTTGVAGASGGGSTAPAAAVGIGDLSGVLTQLTDAVALLGQAIASLQGGNAGGGGPLQVPPPIPTVDQSPYRYLRSTIDAHLARSTVSTTSRAQLQALRDELGRAEQAADQSGSMNPVLNLRLGAQIDLAALPDSDPRRARLQALVTQMQALEATSARTGAIDPLDLQSLSAQHAQIMQSGPPVLG